LRTILKLENEKFVIPFLEPPKAIPPMQDSNWKNFASCETCPSLHKEFESLTLKLEQVSKGEMNFIMKSKDKINSFKRPYKSILLSTRMRMVNLTFTMSSVTILKSLTTPHFIVTLVRLKFLKV